NPFRDSSPEKTATGFLQDLRNGSCSVDIYVCQYALDGHRVSDWRLANRDDQGDSVLLYYKLTKYQASDPRYKWSGEGMVRLLHVQDGWKVVDYSSYF